MRTIAFAIMATLIWAKPAYAYIDPGSIMILLQAIVGGIAVAALFFRRQIASLANIFRRLSPSYQSRHSSDYAKKDRKNTQER